VNFKKITQLLNGFPFVWLSNLKFVVEKILTSDIHIAARDAATVSAGIIIKNMVKSRL
jgi:hypothetical protein